MAVSGRKARGSFKDTVGRSSAEDGEIFCQPCSSDGEWMVAKGYCNNCNEYLCVTCLKVHRRQAVSRNHKVLEGENMPNTSLSSVALNACSELCEKHTNEIVKFYCSTHDVVGCSDCMVIDHKVCKVDRIQDISTNYFNGVEHRELQRKIDEFMKSIEEVNIQIPTNDKSIQETYINAVNDIKSFKKEILEYIDKAEANMMAELSKRKRRDEKLISDLKDHEKTTRGNIQELYKKLQLQLNQANELFIAAKETKKSVTSLGDSIKDMHKNYQFRQYEFVCSQQVKEMIASQFEIGELLEKEKTIAEMEPEFESEIGIKASDDKEDCRIYACALISSNQIILADNNNKCLKTVDIENRKMVEKYKLKSVPCGLAVVSKDRIAVSLSNEEKIQFLTLTQSGKLTKSNAITVKGKFYNIACQDSKIIVLYRDLVVIMDMDGKDIKSISNSNMEWLADIDLGSKSLYLSNGSYSRENRVYRFDFEGNLIATYKDKDISDVRGLCVSRDGTVLVCNWEKEGSIHMISPECKKIKEIVKHDDHVRWPWCISFCDETKNLVLCNCTSKLDPKLKNVIKIFQFR